MGTQLLDQPVQTESSLSQTHRFILACAAAALLLAGAAAWLRWAPAAWAAFHLAVLVPSLIAVSLTWPARRHGGSDGLTARMWRNLTNGFGCLFAAHACHLVAVPLGAGVALPLAGTAFHLLFFLFLLRAFSSFEKVRLAARRQNGRVRALVQHSCDAIAVIAPDTSISYQSPSSLRLLGVAPDALMGTLYLERVHPEDRERFFSCLAQALQTGDAPAIGEWRVRHEQGDWLHFETYVTNRLDDPAVEGIVLNSRDVTERKVLEEELKFRAFHDSLTGLANRALFIDRVEQALVRTRRSGRAAAVLFLDLDNFKLVNDLLGHAEGDRLLVEVAARLRRCIRATDTAARFGGDEFAILLDDMANPADAALVAERVLRDLTIPMRSGERDIVVSTSIGVATVVGTETCDELMHNADSVMYLAKRQGRSRYEVFDAVRHGSVAQRLALEADFRRAIESSEMVVHYQPVVELGSYRVVSLNSVLRWHHPRRGLLEVEDFVDVARQTQQLLSLADWQIENACRQLRAWHLLHPDNTDLGITIPLFAEQLTAPHFPAKVEYLLQRIGIRPDAVTLGIPEAAVLDGSVVTPQHLRELRELGVRLSLMSRSGVFTALHHLRQLQVDSVSVGVEKVLALASGSEADPSLPVDEAVWQRTVVADVEALEQTEALRRLGLSYVRGAFFAGPMRKEVVDGVLHDGGILAPPAATAA
jgi:diguanylate cyclase (GGDEF)-like protein/PAS domain S-box-containing protein